MSELKPCPCCGCENVKIEQYRRDGLRIICKRCSLKREQITLYKSLEWLNGKMVEDWNNRSPQSEWVSVDDNLPESIDGKWSKPVIAMCDKGLIYRLSYFKGDEGSCWQRTSAFASNDSSHVMYWMEIPEIID